MLSLSDNIPLPPSLIWGRRTLIVRVTFITCLWPFIKDLINNSDIDHKIPPNLPLSKGGITPLRKRGARGDFV
jgi:hypothetical protein